MLLVPHQSKVGNHHLQVAMFRCCHASGSLYRKSQLFSGTFFFFQLLFGDCPSKIPVLPPGKGFQFQLLFFFSRVTEQLRSWRTERAFNGLVESFPSCLIQAYTLLCMAQLGELPNPLDTAWQVTWLLLGNGSLDFNSLVEIKLGFPLNPPKS